MLAQDSGAYVDHGKTVDRYGQLIVTTIYDSSLYLMVTNFKTHAIIATLAVIMENICRLLIDFSSWTVFTAALSVYAIAALLKSQRFRRRGVVAALLYTYCLLISSATYRRNIAAALGAGDHYLLGMLFDVSMMLNLYGFTILVLYIGLEKLFTESDSGRKYRSTLATAIALASLYSPSSLFHATRYLLNLGCQLAYGHLRS